MAEKKLFRGLVIHPDGEKYQEIETENNLITAVRDAEPKEETEVTCYDRNILIFPGWVDTHVHARQDVSGEKNYKETFATAVRAALRGGIIAFMDMPNNDVAPVDEATYNAKKELVLSQNLPIEIVLYAGINKDSEPFSDDIPYKCFIGESVGSKSLFFSEDNTLDETIKRYKGQNVSFHCEYAQIIEESKDNETHESRRPILAETAAIKIALELIAKYDIKGTICHLSTADGLEQVKEARKSGLDVAIEITPHHFFFDYTCKVLSKHPELIKMNPPVRTPRDRLAILDAIKESDLEIRWGSDHAPHTFDEKMESNPSGVPNLDTTGQLVSWLIDSDILHRRIAKIFYDSGHFLSRFSKNKYGAVAPGYVGKFTLLDIDNPNTIEKEDIQSKCQWSPWEDIPFSGRARLI